MEDAEIVSLNLTRRTDLLVLRYHLSVHMLTYYTTTTESASGKRAQQDLPFWYGCSDRQASVTSLLLIKTHLWYLIRLQ
jgi:hypothetical protein